MEDRNHQRRRQEVHRRHLRWALRHQGHLSEQQDLYIDRVVFRAAGSNVATVARLFVNDGGDSSSANNNVLFAEKTLAATTLDEAAAFADNVIQTDIWLPAGYRLFVLLGTAVAAGYYVTAVSGEYQYA